MHRIEAPGEQCRDSRGQCTAGTMVVLRESVPGVGFDTAALLEQSVADRCRVLMRAGDQYRIATPCRQLDPALFEVAGVRRQLSGFFAVWRYNSAQWQQLQDCLDQVAVGKAGATACRQYRIQNYWNSRVLVQDFANGPCRFSMSQQADFDAIDRHVVQDTPRLGNNIFRSLWVQVVDIAGILFGQCGDDAAGMAAMAEQGFYIGLDSSAAAGVMAGEAKYHGAFAIHGIKTTGCMAKVSMKMYLCIPCGYLYDEARQGKKWQELAKGWICPECGGSRDHFVEFRLQGKYKETQPKNLIYDL